MRTSSSPSALIALSLSLLSQLQLASSSAIFYGKGFTEENAPKILFPSPTPAHFDDLSLDNGFTPLPTQGPSLELMKKRNVYLDKRGELAARSVTFTNGMLIAYTAADNTCGYISGSLGAVATCPTGSYCGMLAMYPLDGVPGPAFCCPKTGGPCTYQDACYNSAQIPSVCDVGCQQNSDNVLCTNPASPFCVSYTWPDVHGTSFGCAAAGDPTAIIVSYTWFGENDGRAWGSLLYSTTGASGGTSQAISSGPSIVLSSTSSMTSSAASSSSAGGSNGSGGNKGSSTNVGAIVGGVVGGLAVLALAVLAVVFLVLRNRKNHKDDSAAAAGGAGAAGVSPLNNSSVVHDPNTPLGYNNGYGGQPGSMTGMEYYKTGDPRVSAISPSELDGSSPQTAYSGTTNVPYHGQHQMGPSELDGTHVPASAATGVSPVSAAQ